MYPYTLPSGVPCELRELTGAEEELLTNPKLLKNGDAINQMLRNCLVSLGEKGEVSLTDVLDLLAGDRLFMLVKLRQISLGDEVTVALTCPNPHCRATSQVPVNLEDLPVTPYPPEREFSTVLPGSGQTVRFVPLDGHMEKRLAALPEATLSLAMLIRIREIDGVAPTKKTLTEMALKDRQALRQAMLAADGGIDTTIESTCDGCGAPVRTRVESAPDFLFPLGR
ncbi:MAG: T4 family baseplate hub assembly chaperone [Armatimonadota bacterium]